MIYTICGFIFGFCIPYLARRFAKFMPATAAYALYRIFCPVKTVKRSVRRNNARYVKLSRQYFMRSMGWAIIAAALSSVVAAVMAPAIAPWFVGLIWVLLLLYEIDERMLLLPDILTVPLLIAGFCFTAFVGVDHGFCVQSSALGAAFGYALPVLASLFLVAKYPDAFGGGDIKLLAACGAWFGLNVVPYLILGSTIIFGLMCLVKRERAGAFGPAIVITALWFVFF